MSRAFVSEDAAAATAALLPERPVTPGPNPVTLTGLRLIEDKVDRLQHLHDANAADDPARPAIDRDLRYWRARRSTLLQQILSTRPSGCFHQGVTLKTDPQLTLKLVPPPGSGHGRAP